LHQAGRRPAQIGCRGVRPGMSTRMAQ